MAKYDLGASAEEVYSELEADRTSALSSARRNAQLTIPSLVPPESYRAGDALPENHQSVSADCISNLSSILMFMAFPPGKAILKFEIIETAIKNELDADPQARSLLQLALSKKERRHRVKAQAVGLPAMYEMLNQHLLVAGNCLWRMENLEEITVHGLDKFVVRRSPNGQPIVTILKESCVVSTLEPSVREFVLSVGSKHDAEGGMEWINDDDNVDIYTVLKLVWDNSKSKPEKTWEYWQEYDGKVIPGSSVTTDFETPPMYPEWLIPVFGSNYGLAYVERYIGDHAFIDQLAQALGDGAVSAAFNLFFVDPSGLTRLRDLKGADNLAMLAGRAGDVTQLEGRKNTDWNFVAQIMDSTATRLARAYMRDDSIQRSGERVTATEWQRMGRALDRAMGGLYVELSYRTQRHVISRFIALHEEEDPSVGRLPKELILINAVTGLDALGEDDEEENLIFVVKTTTELFPQEAESRFVVDDFINRLSAIRGVDPAGLVKSAEQVAQETQQKQQQAMAAEAVSKGTGPMVQALGDRMNGSQPQPPSDAQGAVTQ